MRPLRLILVILALAAVAAYFTKPGPEQFDAQLEAAIRDKVANTDLDTAGDALPTLALAACKLQPDDCATIVRQAVQVRFEDRLLVTRATVEGLRRSTTCTGAFGRFFCRQPLVD